jgi:hypothetical protein
MHCTDLPATHEAVLRGHGAPKEPGCRSERGGSRNLFSPVALYVTKYVSPRVRPLAPEEAAIRNTAYGLNRADPEAIAGAAPAMAALIDGPCWLVPVPASSGNLTPNFALAHAIARMVQGARVKCAVARARPVESSCHRRLRGLLGLLPSEHAIVRVAGPLRPLPLYFVDNVITSGATITACRRALGWGTGLVYADASTRSNIHRTCSSPSLP